MRIVLKVTSIGYKLLSYFGNSNTRLFRSLCITNLAKNQITHKNKQTNKNHNRLSRVVGNRTSPSKYESVEGGSLDPKGQWFRRYNSK